MRLAVLRPASSSSLGAALVLALAHSMRDAVGRAALSSSEAACLLTACRLHALQWPVSPRADLEQPSWWHRLPPLCALQFCAPPRADLVQPSS